MAADDRLSGARNVEVLNGVRTFKNSVGLRDKNDYYAFTITGRSSFNLLLNDLQNNVDVSLIQNGRTIASSSKENSKPETIAATLEAGTYHVRVYQKRGESKYQLRLKSTPLSSGDTLYAYDGFDYALGSASNELNGGTGWSGSWRNSKVPIVPGLSYTDAAGNGLPFTGNALATSSSAFNFLQTRNTLQTFDTTGGSVWLSFLVQQSAEPLKGKNYAEAGLGLNGSTMMFGGISSDDVAINPFFVSNTPEYTLSNVAPASSVSFIVLRYDFTPSGNDIINLWLNPLLGSNPGAPNISGAFRNHWGSTLSGVALGHGDYRTFVYDEVRIGSSYAAVTGSV